MAYPAFEGAPSPPLDEQTLAIQRFVFREQSQRLNPVDRIELIALNPELIGQPPGQSTRIVSR